MSSVYPSTNPLLGVGYTWHAPTANQPGRDSVVATAPDGFDSVPACGHILFKFRRTSGTTKSARGKCGPCSSHSPLKPGQASPQANPPLFFERSVIAGALEVGLFEMSSFCLAGSTHPDLQCLRRYPLSREIEKWRAMCLLVPYFTWSLCRLTVQEEFAVQPSREQVRCIHLCYRLAPAIPRLV